MSSVNTKRRLGVRDLGINPKAVMKSLDDGESKLVAVFYGLVASYKVKETQYGAAVGFVGDIGAINLETGEEFRGSICYLPLAASEMLQAALEMREDRREALEFAFEVAIKADDNSSVGYIYEVKAPREPGATDPLAAIRERVASQVPALPAPGAIEDQSEEAPKSRRSKSA